MATDLATLERAFLKADEAGDTEAASVLAGEIKKRRAEGYVKESQAPQRNLAQDLARQVGLTARAGITGVAALPNMVGDALGLKSTQALSGVLDKVFPTPESGTERIAQDVAGALSGMGGMAKAAQMASPTGAAGQAVQRLLTERLGTQAAATGAASGAASATREGGGGELAQLAAGLGAGVAAPMAAQAVMNAPRNMIARSVNKSAERAFGKEGERLATETGINLSLGQRTGNKGLLGMENAARQYGPVADRVQDIDVQVANQAINRVSSIADRISKNKPDPSRIGAAIEDTVKGAATKIDDLRNAAASRDYGKVREIAGGQKVIRFDDFSAELRKIVDEYTNVAGADAQKVVAQARAALARITGVSDPGVPARALETPSGRTIKLSGSPAVVGTIDNTVEEAMRTRSFYGKASKGAANVFEDISPNLNRSLAGRLFGAVNRDFDNSASNASGALRQALDKANGNYRNFSQSLDYLEKSALGKLVGDDIADAAFSGAKGSTTAGEAIIDRLMKAHPSSRQASMEILERWNPQLARDTRAFVLRDALEQAASIPPSAKGASQVPISFNKFVSALQGQKAGFERQLQSYGYKPDEIKDIRDTVAAMMRAGDRTGFNFSNTNTQAETMEMVGAMGQAAMGNVTGAASKMLSIGGKYVGLNKVADAMATPEGRQALKTVSSAKASPQAVIAAFATLEASEAP